jgi:hypothetical protein
MPDGKRKPKNMKKKYIEVEIPKGKTIKNKPVYNPYSDTIIIRLKDENPHQDQRKKVHDQAGQ